MQALTYFRDLEAPNDQIYLEKALAVMTSQSSDRGDKDKGETLSPLLVLEILRSKPQLKFSVLKAYLSNRLRVQDKAIKKNEE
jgi:hypothetical protein